MDANDQSIIDEIYRTVPLEKISWNNERPPKLLVELIEAGKVRPCKTIELGCGAGNSAIYLSTKGFEVTGVDFSPTAIELARKNAKDKNVKCDFVVADVVNQLNGFTDKWDFALDWGLLHHILPMHRGKYVENLCGILNPKAKYLSVAFSEKDTGFGGRGKYRKSSLGTALYFSSGDELKRLFEQHFQIIDLRTLEIEGKFQSHIFNYVFMEKKQDRNFL
jgi:SAM-dependent methyltransferase